MVHRRRKMVEKGYLHSLWEYTEYTCQSFSKFLFACAGAFSFPGEKVTYDLLG